MHIQLRMAVCAYYDSVCKIGLKPIMTTYTIDDSTGYAITICHGQVIILSLRKGVSMVKFNWGRDVIVGQAVAVVRATETTTGVVAAGSPAGNILVKVDWSGRTLAVTPMKPHWEGVFIPISQLPRLGYEYE